MKVKIGLALFITAASASVMLASLAQAPLPEETCGTGVPKKEAELRSQACPLGFVGQWTQERAAGSCDWTPKAWDPRGDQWFACAFEVEPQGEAPAPIDPPASE